MWLAVVAMLCCCGGGAVGGGYLYLKWERETPGVQAAAEAYLTAVVDGDNGAAYDLLCEEDRRGDPAEWSPNGFSSSPGPTGFRIIRTNRTDGWNQYTVTTEVTYENRPSLEAVLHVKKQDGAWKVCGPQKL
jgi:hypothetical protein